MMIDKIMLSVMNGIDLMRMLIVSVRLFCVWVGREIGKNVGVKILISNSVVIMYMLILIIVYVVCE